MKKPVIGFVGLTHLGLNSAVASAERGFKVVAYDPEQSLIADLNQEKLDISEPNLLELLTKNKNNIEFTNDTSRLGIADLVYISTDVPTNEAGKSNLSVITESISEITGFINAESLLVILCQVPPGFTGKIGRPKDKLFYQVETLIFGKAVDRALNPERFIIGCADTSKELPESLRSYLESFNCPILPMKYESAELTKIAINMFLISSVSTTNTLAEVCENIGANWSEIAPALKLDKRIGPHAYLSPGLGIAGGNLERDINTILEIGKEHNTNTNVVKAWVENSKYRKNWALDLIIKKTKENKIERIGVLGLTYKENTHSLKNSASIELINSLKEVKITAYDPAASSDAVSSTTTRRASSSHEAMESADLLVIMTPWDEFRKIDPSDLSSRMRGKIVIDPYKIFNGATLRNLGFTYHSLGE